MNESTFISKSSGFDLGLFSVKRLGLAKLLILNCQILCFFDYLQEIKSTTLCGKTFEYDLN